MNSYIWWVDFAKPRRKRKKKEVLLLLVESSRAVAFVQTRTRRGVRVGMPLYERGRREKNSSAKGTTERGINYCLARERYLPNHEAFAGLFPTTMRMTVEPICFNRRDRLLLGLCNVTEQIAIATPLSSQPFCLDQWRVPPVQMLLYLRFEGRGV